jgi:hypothetical protein
MKAAFGYFRHVHRQHWHIKSYHKATKHVCHTERFLGGSKGAISNHLC